jgi:hypothetical protein
VSARPGVYGDSPSANVYVGTWPNRVIAPAAPRPPRPLPRPSSRPAGPAPRPGFRVAAPVCPGPRCAAVRPSPCCLALAFSNFFVQGERGQDRAPTPESPRTRTGPPPGQTRPAREPPPGKRRAGPAGQGRRASGDEGPRPAGPTNGGRTGVTGRCHRVFIGASPSNQWRVMRGS